MNKYRIALSYSPEDQGYIAVVPELDGCSAFGETPAEAATEVGYAIEAWIEAAKAAGNPIPLPMQQAVEGRRSGKLLLRLGPSLHETVTVLAESDGQSVNSYIVSAVHLKIGFDAGRAIGDHTRFPTGPFVDMAPSSLFKGSSLVGSALINIEQLEKPALSILSVESSVQHRPVVTRLQ